MSLQAVRDHLLYNYGYFQGRSLSFTDSLTKVAGSTISKVSSGLALPLPLLSFLALPFFSSTSTTVSLGFFWLTWSAFVWSYDPLQVEVYGTTAARLLFFLLPGLMFLAFDLMVPSLSVSMKASGEKQLPSKLRQRKVGRVVAVATFNTLLGLFLQAAVEYVLTEVVHFRSLLRVSSFIPTPWKMAKDVLLALAARGILHYVIHRYILHASPRTSPLARWHLSWAHSLRYPFSLAAAYDHPVCYLLAHWVPVYVPGFMLRLHVLSWCVLVALSSLEQLFVYSGYDVLPSRILLAGMARRADAHYATKGAGNFGHWGVMDFVCGTGCGGESDIVDDLEDEAESMNTKERISGMKNNVKGLVGDAKERFINAGVVDEDNAATEEPPSPQDGKRRSKRKAKKPSTA